MVTPVIKEYLELCGTFRTDDAHTVAAMREVVIPYLEGQAAKWEHAALDLEQFGALKTAGECADNAVRIRERLAVAYARLGGGPGV